MALTEERVLGSIQINIQGNTINAEWHDLIKRDGEVISRNYHNKAYSQEQKDEFLSEVEGAAEYISILGW